MRVRRRRSARVGPLAGAPICSRVAVAADAITPHRRPRLHVEVVLIRLCAGRVLPNAARLHTGAFAIAASRSHTAEARVRPLRDKPCESQPCSRLRAVLRECAWRVPVPSAARLCARELLCRACAPRRRRSRSAPHTIPGGRIARCGAVARHAEPVRKICQFRFPGCRETRSGTRGFRRPARASSSLHAVNSRHVKLSAPLSGGAPWPRGRCARSGAATRAHAPTAPPSSHPPL